MRGSVLVAAAVVVVAVALGQAQAQAEYAALAVLLGKKIIGLWRSQETEFLDHKCHLTVKPKIRRWQLYYEGRMWCPGLTPIRGEALTRSHSGVAGKTVQDFAKKALEGGVITEEDAKIWVGT